MRNRPVSAASRIWEAIKSHGVSSSPSAPVPVNKNLMIEVPTTLVLGAGASAPYGFPTGRGLLKEVLERLDPKNQYPVNYEQQCGWLGFTDSQAIEFREVLLKSGKSSVDAFLEHRPEFIPIGKAAIALSLIPYEIEARLFEPRTGAWYEYLFTELNARREDFGKNQVSVLTFNYDRSLEHYLSTALQNSYNLHSSECREMMKHIPIIHLHGDLGSPPYMGGRPFAPEFSKQSLEQAATGIRIIHEGFDGDEHFARARKILQQSQKICFLGFGYDPTNIQRLGVHGGDISARLMGSAYGLTRAESQRVRVRFQGQATHLELGNEVQDVLAFLRNNPVLWGG
jgi:hypothetical protein